MRELTNQELKNICLEILEEIDSICKKNDIKYFMNFGTLIGAVRHQGYIPWDDDVDICMLREDYERFLKVAEDSKYRVMHDQNHEYYYFNFARVCAPNTLLKLTGITDVKNMGVFVDIFPIDYVPDDEKARARFYDEVQVWDRCVEMAVPNEFKNSITFIQKLKVLKNNFVQIFKAIMKGNKFDSVVAKRKEFMTQYLKKTNTLCCLCPPDERMAFACIDYTELIELKFEYLMLPAPKEYDKILRKYYGDYMTPPPVEEQVSWHHFKAYFID